MVCQGYVSVTKSDISYIIHFLLSSLAQVSLKTIFSKWGQCFPSWSLIHFSYLGLWLYFRICIHLQNVNIFSIVKCKCLENAIVQPSSNHCSLLCKTLLALCCHLFISNRGGKSSGSWMAATEGCFGVVVHAQNALQWNSSNHFGKKQCVPVYLAVSTTVQR